MPSIDLQYPHPDDTVGWAFSAGGTYDNSGRIEMVRAADDPPVQIGLVICQLLDSNNVVLDLQTAPVFSSPPTASWNVNFVETSNYDDCQVKAALSFLTVRQRRCQIRHPASTCMGMIQAIPATHRLLHLRAALSSHRPSGR